MKMCVYTTSQCTVYYCVCTRSSIHFLLSSVASVCCFLIHSFNTNKDVFEIQTDFFYRLLSTNFSNCYEFMKIICASTLCGSNSCWLGIYNSSRGVFRINRSWRIDKIRPWFWSLLEFFLTIALKFQNLKIYDNWTIYKSFPHISNLASRTKS